MHARATAVDRWTDTPSLTSHTPTRHNPTHTHHAATSRHTRAHVPSVKAPVNDLQASTDGPQTSGLWIRVIPGGVQTLPLRRGLLVSLFGLLDETCCLRTRQKELDINR